MKRTRLRVTFEGSSAEILDRLAALRGGKSEVLRDALALEDLVVAATKRGADILIREPDGTMKQIVRA